MRGRSRATAVTLGAARREPVRRGAKLRAQSGAESFAPGLFQGVDLLRFASQMIDPQIGQRPSGTGHVLAGPLSQLSIRLPFAVPDTAIAMVNSRADCGLGQLPLD